MVYGLGDDTYGQFIDIVVGPEAAMVGGITGAEEAPYHSVKAICTLADLVIKARIGAEFIFDCVPEEPLASTCISFKVICPLLGNTIILK